VRVEAGLAGVEIASPYLEQTLQFTDGRLSVQESTAEGDFSARLGSLQGQGTVKVADLEHPVAEFRLSFPELNIHQLSGLLRLPASSRQENTGEQPSDLLAYGEVEVARLEIPPLSAQGFQATVRLYSDRLEADPFSLELYGGKSGGRLGIDLRDESLLAQLDAHVEAVQLEQLLAGTGAETDERVTGEFEAKARLGIPLATAESWTILSGEGQFAVRHGSLSQLEIEGNLPKLARILQINPPRSAPRFHFFGGDFRIRNQRIHSQRLRLETDRLQASLKGSLGFDQTLRYRGTGWWKNREPEQAQSGNNPFRGLGRLMGKVVERTLRLSGMEVAFSVQGTLDKPKVVLGATSKPVHQARSRGETQWAEAKTNAAP
jgi:hypothetical protein